MPKSRRTSRPPHKSTKVKKKSQKAPRPSPFQKSTRPLPATFRGAAVIRGEGMNADEFDTFLERRARDAFDADRDNWLVVEDRALHDIDGSTRILVFNDKADAIKCAKGLSNGNVDHRVIKLTDQILVIGTYNDL